MQRYYSWLLLAVLASCGEETVRRSVVGRSSCNDDTACAAGQICVDGYCAAPLTPESYPELKEQTSNALLEAVAQSPFSVQNAGNFSLTFSVPNTTPVDFKDGVVQAKLRAKFQNGVVNVWGFEIDAAGGPVVLPTPQGNRTYYITNVRVRSSNEASVPLVAGDFPLATATAPLDLEVSADVGADDTGTVRLTARLDQVQCKFEFQPSDQDSHLHVRVLVAEKRDLYGAPNSGLTIDGLGTDADLKGAEIPQSWIRR
jgi:hypothetical protein